MIVVTAPTGAAGRQALVNVPDGGEPVRVIARDPSRLPPRTRGRGEAVRGSRDDSGVVGRAVAGADAASRLAPPEPRAEGVGAAV